MNRSKSIPVTFSMNSPTWVISDSRTAPESASAISCRAGCNSPSWLLPGAMLAPVASVTPLLRLEGHLGKALPCLARHDLVAAFRDLVEAGCPSVKAKTDGVEDGGLSGAGGTGNGENAVGRIVGMGEIHLPFAREGIQILEPDAENLSFFLLSYLRPRVCFLQRHDDLPIGVQERRALILRDFMRLKAALGTPPSHPGRRASPPRPSRSGRVPEPGCF